MENQTLLSALSNLQDNMADCLLKMSIQDQDVVVLKVLDPALVESLQAVIPGILDRLKKDVLFVFSGDGVDFNHISHQDLRSLGMFHSHRILPEVLDIRNALLEEIGGKESASSPGMVSVLKRLDALYERIASPKAEDAPNVTKY